MADREQHQTTPKSGRHTAKSLLNLFQGSPRTDAEDRSNTNAPEPKRDLNSNLRAKRKISYVNLADSDDNQDRVEKTPSEVSSAFPSPKAMRSRNKVEVDDRESTPELAPSVAPALDRTSSNGRSLRPRAELKAPIKASDMIILRQPKRRKLVQSGASCRSSCIVTSDKPKANDAVALTSRQTIRHNIATETATKRAKFLVAKKDYFLPLLPENNYVQKLIEKASFRPVGNVATMSNKADDSTTSVQDGSSP